MAAELVSDPISRLEHDHSHLSALVSSLREALEASRARGDVEEHRVELAETLRLLTDDLFTHFAREEEGLFPFVVAELPDLSARVAAVVATHDQICGAVSRMTYAVGDRTGEGRPPESRPEAPPIGELEGLLLVFERFDAAYAAHAREELELLRALDRRLDPAQRTVVAGLLREL